MTEDQVNNFDTFFFVRHQTNHPVEAVAEYCDYIGDCHLEWLLEQVVTNNEREELDNLVGAHSNDYVWALIHEVGVEIMTIPDEFDPEVVSFYYNHQADFARLLYSTFMSIYAGILMFLPSILIRSPLDNWRYVDYRATSNSAMTILRLFRGSTHV